MCGILAIINSKEHRYRSQDLISACNIIRHRGPDDEGFLTWSDNEDVQVWAGQDTATSTRQHWQYEALSPDKDFRVGFGHRRLSIVDLSPTGHQPMTFKEAGLTITFNGEVYNYLEVRDELKKLGHTFVTQSDTEVILHAWAEWGAECLQKLNGMFVFIILDYKKNRLYAVRDRFGVKPLYYYNDDSGVIVLASEIKQIRTLKGFKTSLNEKIAKQFLATGAVDHNNHTFDTQVNYVAPGHYMYVDLSKDRRQPQLVQWYELKPKKWTGSWDEAVTQFRSILTDAIRLRLRADVTVGSCLSGGLDSSSIVCITADLMKQKDFVGLETVTACFDESKYDEWKFAEEVIKQTQAHPHRVFPSFKQLEEDFDSFLWHQDDPTGSTSQFSQWSVFKRTHEAGLKVMVDGQGADEQLAGYGGNDIPFYSGLLKKGAFGAYWDEMRHYKKQHGALPYSFLIGSAQVAFDTVAQLLPKKLRINNPANPDWVTGEEDLKLNGTIARDLKENLLRQVLREPLPALLRYEDRNSMAWSVESRTPFMDYRLFEFTLGLPERFVYKNGVRKTILREAMKGIIPDAIYNRRDKMGFVTPEETWLKGEGKKWFLDALDNTCKVANGLVVPGKLKTEVNKVIDGTVPFNFLPWRVNILGRWLQKNT